MSYIGVVRRCRARPVKLALPILAALVFTGCSSLPHRTIIVTDERGQPLVGAAVSPYPVSLLPFGPGSHGNQTDMKGRVSIYDVIPGGSYSLNAVGFHSRQISFPQRDDTTYVLRRDK